MNYLAWSEKAGNYSGSPCDKDACEKTCQAFNDVYCQGSNDWKPQRILTPTELIELSNDVMSIVSDAECDDCPGFILMGLYNIADKLRSIK